MADITVTNGVDTPTGSDFLDRIYGVSSNDTLFGADGNDSLYVASGRDLIFGASGLVSFDGCYANDGDSFRHNGEDLGSGGSGGPVICDFHPTLGCAFPPDALVFATGLEAEASPTRLRLPSPAAAARKPASPTRVSFRSPVTVTAPATSTYRSTASPPPTY